VKKFPEIDLSQYDGRELGSGGEGCVYRYDLPGALLGFQQDKVTVAAKKFETALSHSSNETRSDSFRGCDEVLALFKLRHHPNVVGFIGRGTIGVDRYLIVEYCPRSLFGEIEEARGSGTLLHPTDFVRWATGICDGMRFVHENHGHHGDLKPQNILIDVRGRALIADFGLSTTTISSAAKMNSNRGTARYMAPEQHRGAKLDGEAMKSCDVWSFGIILWEMITCQMPFATIDDIAIPYMIGAISDDSPPLPLPHGNDCESVVNTIEKCWSANHRRPSFYTLHSYMHDVTEEIAEGINGNDAVVLWWSEECQEWLNAH
ncbi:hypothetical protein PFISCL1PPCAC_7082, partial [Pristionchus fissidentatus]